MFLKRSKKKELIDLGLYSPKEYKDCLDQLFRIGNYLGGDKATLKALKEMPSPSSLIDVGCGGGDFTQKLSRLYPQAKVSGIDLSLEAISYAQSKNKAGHVTFSCQKLEDVPSKSYDVVISTLVLHHLSDEEIPLFLSHCLRVAKQKVILNDLYRHPIAWLSFAMIAPLFFRNRLIIHDGLLSIRRSFSYEDLEGYLRKIPGSSYQIKHRFPFRFLVTLESSCDR